MTTRPPGDVALDLAVLARLLRGEGIDVEGTLSASRVGLGQSNLTYVVTDAGGRRWIVRRPPRGELLQSAHDVLREYRIVSALGPTGVPVPHAFALFDDRRLADTPVVVVEHVEGLVVDTLEVAAGLPPEVRRTIGTSMAEGLAAIHAVNIRSVGLEDLASHSSYAARQVRRWSRQWEISRTRDLPELDRLTEALRRRAPAARAVCLVHGDLHLRNVLVDPMTGALRSVLDWELATLGDPVADLGSLLAYWPEAGDPPSGLFDASALEGFARRKELAETYAGASGTDLADLDYWHVLGLWKIAIIAEGIRRRGVEEPSNAAASGPPVLALTEHLVERACALAARSNLL